MLRNNTEHRAGGVTSVDRSREFEPLLDSLEELVEGTSHIGLFDRAELVIIGPAYQQRQFRPKMSGEANWQTITRRTQNRAQYMPSDMPIGPEIGHDFIQPSVGGLQRFIENIETGSAHG